MAAGGAVADVTSAAMTHQVMRVNRLAAASFVAALFLGLVIAPLTLPLSYVAQRQIRTSGESGASLARAATIISAVYLVIGLVVVGLYVHLAVVNPVG